MDYGWGGGITSNPPSHCFSFGSTPAGCWLTARANDEGIYAAEFTPGPLPGKGIGIVFAWADGYQADIQWIPTGTATPVRNLRVRRARRIVAGESVTISVEPDSALCTDLEDLWVPTSRCEVVQVVANTAGTLVVEARAADGGGVVPSIFWMTSGNYAGLITRPAPATVSIPIRGGTYGIFVGTPDGTASQRFSVSSSLQ